MIRVLITGCSKHSKTLIESLRENYNKEDIFVVGVNSNENNLLRSDVDVAMVVSPITDERYIDELLYLCEEFDIQIIIPYITKELELLSLKKNVFEEKNIKVSISNLESISILNDKMELYNRYSMYMPKSIEVMREQDIYDFYFRKCNEKNICLKVSNSCGGRGFAIVDNDECFNVDNINVSGVPRYISFYDLIQLYRENGDRYRFILSEYIKGLDYSSCALSDNGNTLGICGYIGYKIEYGAVTSGKIAHNETAYEIHKKIIKDFSFDGNSCADFILGDNGKVYLLEINPRVNATLPFVAKSGANLLYDRLQILLGRDVEINYEINDNLYMNKYYTSEYYDAR